MCKVKARGRGKERARVEKRGEGERECAQWGGEGRQGESALTAVTIISTTSTIQLPVSNDRCVRSEALLPSISQRRLLILKQKDNTMLCACVAVHLNDYLYGIWRVCVRVCVCTCLQVVHVGLKHACGILHLCVRTSMRCSCVRWYLVQMSIQQYSSVQQKERRNVHECKCEKRSERNKQKLIM